VADAWNHRVQKFTSDFTPVAQWPIQSWESDSVVNKPYLRVDRQSNVYVGDPERYRILIFDSQGKFLMTFGQYGFDTASFGLPLGMAFDASGNLYVVDSNNNRVLKFGPLQPDQAAQPQ
jgi:DNA-binding beta-propeller fold protein YncE